MRATPTMFVLVRLRVEQEFPERNIQSNFHFGFMWVCIYKVVTGRGGPRNNLVFPKTRKHVFGCFLCVSKFLPSRTKINTFKGSSSQFSRNFKYGEKVFNAVECLFFWFCSE